MVASGSPTLAGALPDLQVVNPPEVIDLRTGGPADDRAPDDRAPGTETTTVTERGSFVRAHCPACGWSAPARRARALAEVDAQGHRDAGHGHRG